MPASGAAAQGREGRLGRLQQGAAPRPTPPAPGGRLALPAGQTPEGLVAARLSRVASKSDGERAAKRRAQEEAGATFALAVRSHPILAGPSDVLRPAGYATPPPSNSHRFPIIPI